MFPSWGWSHEIFMVETGPMFRRSISEKASTSRMKAGSLVITEQASV